MKNILLKSSFILLAILMCFSCNDEFLEKAPLDEISNSSFWNTENDLLVYNNRLYDLVRSDVNVPIVMGHDGGFNSHRYGIWHIEGFSDNTAPRHSRHNNYQKVRAGKHAIPGSPFWYGYRGFNFLRAINVGLDSYGLADITDEIRNKYIGEARLMRGWFYADKISKFGSAQWVDRELTTEDEEILNGPRDDRDFVMNKVLEDLTFASTNIPNNWGDGGAPGRINRWGALLVLSRVALFEGTWRKYHGLGDADKWLNASANAAKEIMEDGPYSLFSTGDPSQDYNS